MDLRIGRRLEAGRRSESYICIGGIDFVSLMSLFRMWNGSDSVVFTYVHFNYIRE